MCCPEGQRITCHVHHTGDALAQGGSTSYNQFLLFESDQLRIIQRGNTRQNLTFQQFQAGTATRGNVTHLVG
jgi:hypothetical protein